MSAFHSGNAMSTDNVRIRETAIHEAGHAVLHLVLTLGLKEVTIVPDYDQQAAGASVHGGEWGNPASDLGEEDDDTATLRMLAEEAFWLRHAIACYAGAEAVKQLCPDEPNPEAGADSDFHDAKQAIWRVTEDPESMDLLFALAKRRCTLLVEHYRAEISALAIALLAQSRLSGQEARKVIFDSLKGRRGRLRMF